MRRELVEQRTGRVTDGSPGNKRLLSDDTESFTTPKKSRSTNEK